MIYLIQLRKCGNAIKYQYKLVLLKVKCTEIWYENEEEYEDKVKRLENVTLTSIMTEEIYKSDFDKTRINILQKIKDTYAKINPYVFYESIVVAVVFVMLSIIRKQKNGDKIIVLVGLIGIYLCRMFIVSFTAVTMYTVAINVMYLSITYVIQMLFALLVNVFLVQELIKVIKKDNYIC